MENRPRQVGGVGEALALQTSPSHIIDMKLEARCIIKEKGSKVDGFVLQKICIIQNDDFSISRYLKLHNMLYIYISKIDKLLKVTTCEL